LMQSPRVIAVKGQDELNLVVGVPRKADVTIKGKVVRRGLKVWPVGSSLCKIELYGWLAQPKAVDGQPDPFGYCHFPQYDPEYFKMITAEKLVTKIVKGYKKREWVKERERNEALDCRVYARAAASLVGMDRFNESVWDQMRTSLGGIKEKAAK
jgi:phage terminase large subunit GpA-like protein